MGDSKNLFTIGIEEEFQVVDPETRELRSHLQQIFEEGKIILKENIKPEMHQSVVEVGTNICKDIKEAREIVSCVRAKEYLSKANAAIPAGLEVPNETEHTSLLAVDFAICKDAEGHLIPQLIELQGFASLYGYQEFITSMFKKHFAIPDEFQNLFNGYTHTNLT